MKTQKVWFVTGASKGLGLALVKRLLAEGCKVAATSRDAAALRREVGHAGEDFIPLQVDLVNNDDVSQTVAEIISRLGTIDVVVNNAGYGQLGTLEELTEQEARENFDVNVFGSLNVIRNVMPHFRAKRSGAFFNIASIAGFMGPSPAGAFTMRPNLQWPVSQKRFLLKPNLWALPRPSFILDISGQIFCWKVHFAKPEIP